MLNEITVAACVDINATLKEMDSKHLLDEIKKRLIEKTLPTDIFYEQFPKVTPVIPEDSEDEKEEEDYVAEFEEIEADMEITMTDGIVKLSYESITLQDVQVLETLQEAYENFIPPLSIIAAIKKAKK